MIMTPGVGDKHQTITRRCLAASGKPPNGLWCGVRNWSIIATRGHSDVAGRILVSAHHDLILLAVILVALTAGLAGALWTATRIPAAVPARGRDPR
jgi:hypothetical protein